VTIASNPLLAAAWSRRPSTDARHASPLSAAPGAADSARGRARLGPPDARKRQEHDVVTSGLHEQPRSSWGPVSPARCCAIIRRSLRRPRPRWSIWPDGPGRPYERGSFSAVLTTTRRRTRSRRFGAEASAISRAQIQSPFPCLRREQAHHLAHQPAQAEGTLLGHSGQHPA